MIVVTGGCGFIGSNIVKMLNRKGIKPLVADDAWVVDRMQDLDFMFKSVRNQDVSMYTLLERKHEKIEVIFHHGAITDTMHGNHSEIIKTNFELSRGILEFCHENQIRLIYASSAAVYGDCSLSVPCSEEHEENPLNVYGFSKSTFDRYVKLCQRHRQQLKHRQVTGLRYFNVYGPGECHKGKMASPVNQFTRQALETGEIRVFEGSENFFRDFVHVDDVVNVNEYFLDNGDDHLRYSGVFNCGTGESHSFMEIADIVAEETGAKIREILMPDRIKHVYQRFTQARMDKLWGVGCGKGMVPFEKGVRDYVRWLCEKHA